MEIAPYRARRGTTLGGPQRWTAQYQASCVPHFPDAIVTALTRAIALAEAEGLLQDVMDIVDTNHNGKIEFEGDYAMLEGLYMMS